MLHRQVSKALIIKSTTGGEKGSQIKSQVSIISRNLPLKWRKVDSLNFMSVDGKLPDFTQSKYGFR